MKVHGGALGNTYFDPPPANYKIVWQIRNEDFFALRWGVPDFIRQHVARNTAPYVGGYFTGSETYIPALDYFTASQEPVAWKWAFERQWLFYMLWGRLLYDPATPDAFFEAEFERRCGRGTGKLLKAYSLASSTQLRLASLYDSRWDFTLYSEGFLALQGEHTRYISVDALIRQPTLDPDYVSVADYVETLGKGSSFAAGRVTPPALADALERDCREALRLVSDLDTTRNASLRYEVADVRTWAHLGLHLSEKLRGAVALATFRAGGGEERRREALQHLERALGHWDEVIATTRPLYRDMPLAHYNGNAFVAGATASFLYGVGINLVRRHLTGLPPAAVASATLGTSALLTLPFALANWPTAAIPMKSWFSAAMLGVVCTGLAFVMYYRLIARIGASRASTVTYLIPVFGVAWAWLLLDEPLTIKMGIAGAMILGSVALSQRTGK